MVHIYICADLAQDMLLSADDCEALGLLPRHWPNHEVQDSTKYSKRYTANNVVTTTKEAEENKEKKKEDESEGTVDLSALRDALWSNTGDI